jgi:hypothetical protein
LVNLAEDSPARSRRPHFELPKPIRAGNVAGATRGPPMRHGMTELSFDVQCKA